MEHAKYTIHKGKESQIKTTVSTLDRLRKSLGEISYRMDSVRELAGVNFVNDSRAVDLLATRDSFKCLAGPTIWLTTTTAYDRDFELIEKYIRKSIKAIVVYGIAADDMRSKLEKYVETFITVPDLSTAVKESFKLALTDDTVIYSPSCVAIDGYLNFVDRGQAFEKFVNELDK